jgi:hypothetical protein
MKLFNEQDKKELSLLATKIITTALNKQYPQGPGSLTVGEFMHLKDTLITQVLLSILQGYIDLELGENPSPLRVKLIPEINKVMAQLREEEQPSKKNKIIYN